jgi:hypothetical protein
MSILEIGCCGAVCKTCIPYKNNICRGCKIGYDKGERDIKKARCKIKVCCINKSFITCGDCSKYLSCKLIQGLYAKNGYKYKKYKESMEFIRNNGYEEFLNKITLWKCAYGQLK